MGLPINFKSGIKNVIRSGATSAIDFGFDQLSGGINAGRARKAWERQNAYNHPKQQMQRLKEAGLNPALVYGSSSGGVAGQASSYNPGSAPNTSRYQDARVKGAQTDLTQLQADLTTEKLAQAKMATEAQRSIHTIMRAHPERLVSATGPDGNAVELTQPSVNDRYQTQALARHGMVMDDAEMRQIDAIVKGETTLEQAFATLGRTRATTATEQQRYKQILNNNRAWASLDELIKGSKSPEIITVLMKLLLNSIGKTN